MTISYPCVRHGLHTGWAKKSEATNSWSDICRKHAFMHCSQQCSVNHSCLEPTDATSSLNSKFRGLQPYYFTDKHCKMDILSHHASLTKSKHTVFQSLFILIIQMSIKNYLSLLHVRSDCYPASYWVHSPTGLNCTPVGQYHKIASRPLATMACLQPLCQSVRDVVHRS